jgi:hypothetical protein
MKDANVGSAALRDKTSRITDRAENSEAITATMQEPPVDQTLPTSISPHLAALIGEGSVRAPESSRYLPINPAKSQAPGKSAAEYVAESRR